MTGYVIDCTRNQIGYKGYVGRAPFYLTTHHLSEAKIWKSRAGAEQWLAVRGLTKGYTVVAIEGELSHKRRPCASLAA